MFKNKDYQMPINVMQTKKAYVFEKSIHSV